MKLLARRLILSSNYTAELLNQMWLYFSSPYELREEDIRKYEKDYTTIKPFFSSLLLEDNATLYFIFNQRNASHLTLYKSKEKIHPVIWDYTSDTYSLMLDLFSNFSQQTGYYGSQLLILLYQNDETEIDRFSSKENNKKTPSD
jgi:hypothetical protein